ncbi:MAG TPA: glycosyltransferase family 2 protein [Gammaproteobacteria bacterium]
MQEFFYICLVLLFYTYIGYPVIVFALAKLIRRGFVYNKDFEPNVSVIIIVHNAEQYLQRKIDNILSSDYPLNKLELIIINDGSTDSTAQIIDNNKNCIRFINFDIRRGKSACIDDAVRFASHDYIVFADVRQLFSVDAISSLIAPLADENIGAVSGELVFADENHNAFSKGIDAYWRYEKLIRSSEASIDSVIGVTGAIYSIRKRLYSKIPEGLVLDDVLIPMQVILNGGRVIFANNAIASDIPSSDSTNEKRRKIRTLAGNYQLITVCPKLLNPFKNRVFIQFVSHKLLRLMAPFFMLGILFSSVLLSTKSSYYTLLVLLQLITYIMAYAAYNNTSSQVFRYKPVRILNTFIYLNWYSFLALLEFIKGKKTHLW